MVIVNLQGSESARVSLFSSLCQVKHKMLASEVTDVQKLYKQTWQC